MRPSLELNKAHLKTPTVGDYWTEHFVLQFVVLRVLDSGNIVIAGKDRTIEDGQTVDLNNAYEITPEQLKKLVTYPAFDGFVCDVTPVTFTSQGWVDAWEKEHHERYKPYTGEIKTNETVISELPDHVVGASPVLQDEELCQKEKTLRAIGYLENDLNALLSGEWYPDKHSIEASLDNLRIVQEFVSSK